MRGQRRCSLWAAEAGDPSLSNAAGREAFHGTSVQQKPPPQRKRRSACKQNRKQWKSAGAKQRFEPLSSKLQIAHKNGRCFGRLAETRQIAPHADPVEQ